MSTGVVLVDIDGILANFNKGADEILEGYRYPRYTHPSQVPQWNWLKGIGLDSVDSALWYKIDVSDTFWYQLPSLITPDTWAALALTHRDVPLVFATTRIKGRQVYQQTYQWLREHGIGSPTILLCRSKSDLLGSLSNVAAIVEDNADTVQFYADAGVPVFMPVYPYNSHVLHNGVRKFDSSDDAIKEMLKEYV